MYSLHLAKIIITNDRDPIFNGALLINDSKILQVGKKEDFGDVRASGHSPLQVIDHGEALICPGFINLHCHLIYSMIQRAEDRGQRPETLFSWLENLVDVTFNWTLKDYKISIQKGIELALSTGTTFLVENTSSLISVEELAKSPLKALIGLEVFGSDEEKSEEVFQKALSSQIEFTLSPHAPYDVSKPLWERIINWSKENKKPILTHLEESPQEKIWWQTKQGEAVNFWKKIKTLEPKLKYWKKYNSGIDFLNKNNLLHENIIATHLSQASLEDLKLLKEKNIKLVHCPRSNYYLNNGTANLKLWEELDFLWGIGTDSVASNNNLDLLEEIRFTINQQKLTYNFLLSNKKAFEAITLKGAEILGESNELGKLKENYCADFLVYDIKDKPESLIKKPYSLVVREINNKKDLKEMWINGKNIWKLSPLLHKI